LSAARVEYAGERRRSRRACALALGYGALQLQVAPLSKRHTSPSGHVYPPQVASHDAGMAHTQNSFESLNATGWQTAPSTHVPPASHVPLQSGLVPPHGELGETQRQLKSNSESAHTPSPAHEPPHVGYGPDSHGPAGAPPWSATSEQSCIDAAVAFAATKM